MADTPECDEQSPWADFTPPDILRIIFALLVQVAEESYEESSDGDESASEEVADASGEDASSSSAEASSQASDEGSSSSDGAASDVAVSSDGAVSDLAASSDEAARYVNESALATRDLLAVSAVCSLWRSVATTEPTLWRNLHFDLVAAGLTDARLARLIGFAKGGMHSLSLSGASRLTDASAELFSVSSAPQLQLLDLTDCCRLSASAILASRTSGSLILFDFSGLKRLRGSAEEVDEQLAALLSLAEIEAFITVCKAQLYGDRVCGTTSLLDSGGEQCDLCGDIWCPLHPMQHCGNKNGCSVTFCAACAPAALKVYTNEELNGFACRYCGKILCGECAFAQYESSGQKTHVTCGVCGWDMCINCVLDEVQGLTCRTRAAPVPGPWNARTADDCLEFVCYPCWCIDEANLIFCATCCIPYCRFCASDAEKFRLTGRHNHGLHRVPTRHGFVNPSTIQGFCKDCDDKRDREQQRRRRGD
jgi:hypothetical protein